MKMSKAVLNKSQLVEIADKLNDVQNRSDMEKRPLNHMEQSAVQTLFAVSEFMEVCKESLFRRMKGIKGASMRMGQIQYATRSLFNDIINTLDDDAKERFARNSKNLKLYVKPMMLQRSEPWETIVNDEDLFQIATAAWSGVCEMCEKKGTEAKKCPLKKAFDNTMILDPSDGESGCIWRN